MWTRSAMTLLEVTVATMLTGMLMIAVTEALNAGTRTSTTLTNATIARADANAILHDIALELRAADRNFMYQTQGTVTEFSYVVCTGFDSQGNAIYDRGEFGRRIIYDRDAGTLTKVIVSDTEADLVIPLARNVSADGFAVEQMGEDLTIYGNRLRLRLSLDSTLTGADEGNPVAHQAERMVFLRSYLFSSDGQSGSLDEAGGTTTTDTTTTTTTDTTTTTTDTTTDTTTTTTTTDPLPAAEPDIHDHGGPSILWGNDQDTATDQLLLVVSLKVTGNKRLATEKVDVQFLGTNYSGMTVTYGWQSNTYGLQADEIRIYGTVTGAIGITVTAAAEGNNKDAGTFYWTRETNYY